MEKEEFLTSEREHRKRAELNRILDREEVQAKLKSISSILKKSVDDRTTEDLQILENSPDIVDQIEKRIKKRTTIKERTKEVEDPPDVFDEKCRLLAETIRSTEKLVIYTGAGISTAASIPDYRGPNGVWTLLQKGKTIGTHELSDAEPTTTHMAIAQLYHKGIVSHVVSQNCDGLHLRSGLPRHALSEVHGNMYIEVCAKCRPPREYIRLFDVTERTSIHKHKTGRKCNECRSDLIDTIVHFGEKGLLKSPLNWSGAVKAADKSGMILCLGTSLKVLRKYSCLWGMDRAVQERPVLCIVNLQWTPKDHIAAIKINGKCDEVMVQVMKHLELNVPQYRREEDPIFRLAVPICNDEMSAVARKPLTSPPSCSNRLDENLDEDKQNLSILNCKAEQCAHVYVKRKKNKSNVEFPSSINHNVSDHFVGKTALTSSPANLTSKSRQADHLLEDELKYSVNYSLIDRTVKGSTSVTVTDPLVDATDQAEENDNDNHIVDDNEDLKNSESNSSGAQEEIQNESETSSKFVSTPGWFGKGYRKLQKRRKRL